MATLWPKFVSQCKSRLSAIARRVFLSRAHWRQKCLELKGVLQEMQEECAETEAHWRQLERENIELRERVSQLELELAQPRPATLPLGEAPRGQHYGAGMIALCVNLAREIGLRAAVRALRVVFDWLGATAEIPSYQTIRLWMQRIGLDRMQSVKKVSGGVWLTDHTNQIGKEKVMVVLRVSGRRLPRQGIPLRHEDVEVLAVMPGEEWKREDVGKVYQATAERYGYPRAIESDGAVELREPAEKLGKLREKPLVLRDPKHFLANKFEALLRQDAQYQAFVQKHGGARSALQQTELAHLMPPAFKVKARFMNLAPMLSWASAILWHLDHPESQSRRGVTESRMIEKLGWVRDFASSIQQWQVCQEVVSTALTFINRQGIFRGAAKQFRKLATRLTHHPMSQQLVQTVVEFLRKTERRLRPNERLPLSTEVLESSFALYKQLEKQHSKSGFTSLLLAYPTLPRATTPREVARSFARVKVADVKHWVENHLPSTLTSKRLLMFREARTNTQDSATALHAAA